MLDWTHRTSEVPSAGLEIRREADAETLGQLADAFEVLAVRRFVAEYQVRPHDEGKFHVAGHVQAAIEQECVTTLEPVRHEFNEPFEIDFWPQDKIVQPTIDFDVMGSDDPEPIVAGRIEVGRIISQLVSIAIPAFPRAPDAALEQHSTETEGEGEVSSPFAALAKLRPAADS